MERVDKPDADGLSALVAAVSDERDPARRDACWDRLFELAWPVVHAAARRRTDDLHLAEDIAQEVLVRLPEFLAERQIDPADGDAGCERFLTTVATNHARNRTRSETARHRREVRVARFEPGRVERGPMESGSPDATAVALLRQAIGELTPAQRRMITERFLRGRSNVEIAEAEASTPASVAVRVHRAVERLRLVARRRGLLVGSLALLLWLRQLPAMEAGDAEAPDGDSSSGGRASTTPVRAVVVAILGIVALVVVVAIVVLGDGGGQARATMAVAGPAQGWLYPQYRACYRDKRPAIGSVAFSAGPAAGIVADLATPGVRLERRDDQPMIVADDGLLRLRLPEPDRAGGVLITGRFMIAVPPGKWRLGTRVACGGDATAIPPTGLEWPRPLRPQVLNLQTLQDLRIEAVEVGRHGDDARPIIEVRVTIGTMPVLHVLHAGPIGMVEVGLLVPDGAPTPRSALVAPMLRRLAASGE